MRNLFRRRPEIPKLTSQLQTVEFDGERYRITTIRCRIDRDGTKEVNLELVAEPIRPPWYGTTAYGEDDS